jgi:hypothetical protein
MESGVITAPPSTVSRQLVITDASGCTDCPVRTFRETGTLRYEVNINNPTFADLASYRIRTIFLDFVGAEQNHTSGNRVLKVMIDSNGIFKSKEKGAVYEFVTTPRSLAFEYDIANGKISHFYSSPTTCTLNATTWLGVEQVMLDILQQSQLGSSKNKKILSRRPTISTE